MIAVSQGQFHRTTTTTTTATNTTMCACVTRCVYVCLCVRVQLSGVRMRVSSLEGEVNQAKALQEAVEKDFTRTSSDLAAVSGWAGLLGPRRVGLCVSVRLGWWGHGVGVSIHQDQTCV